MTGNRTALVCWVTLAVAVVAAGVAGGAVGVGEPDGIGGADTVAEADAAVTTNHTNATLEDVRSSPSSGALVVELANANGSVNVTVATVDGPEDTYTRTVEESGDVRVVRVAPGVLPTGDLSPATVSVSVGGQQIGSDQLALDYVELDPNTARIRPNGTAVFGTSTSVGTDAVTLRLLGDGGAVTTATATRRNGSLVVGGEAVEQYLLPPQPFRVTGPAASETVPVTGGGASVDPGQLADRGNTTVTAGDGRITLSSPALVNDETYTVTVHSGAQYTTTTTASGGSVTVENPALLELASVNVTVAYDGTDVVSVDDYRIHEVTTATVVAATGNTTTLNLTESALPSQAGLADASVIGAERTVAVDVDRTPSGDVTLDGVSLNVSGSYRVLLRTADGASYPVRVGAGDALGEIQTPAAAGGTDGGTDGGAGLADSPVLLGGAGAVLVLVIVGAFAVLQTDVLGGPSGGGRESRSETVEVEVLDPDGSVHDGPVEVVYREAGPLGGDGSSGRQRSQPGRNDPAGGRGRKQDKETIDGRRTLEFFPKEWELTVQDPLSIRGGSVRFDPERSDTVTLDLEPQRRRLRVVDEVGDPIDGVEVAVDGDRRQTDASGEATFQRPPGERRTNVRTDHPVYEDADRRLRWASDGTTELALDVDSGGLAVTAAVDGEPTAGIDVTVERADGRPVADDPRTGETDGDGSVSFSGLVVGEYTVTADAGESFTTDERTVSVAVDRTEPVELSVSFRYELSPDHDRRLSALADAADELRPSQQLDGAVHHYYGTVIESLADVIGGLPDAGHRFVDAPAAPAAVTAALLDTGEELLDLTRVALNDKRNVDLFTACAEMQSVRTGWADGYDEAALFEALTAEPNGLIRDVSRRLEETDEFLQSRRDEVTVDSPVREPYAEVDSYARSAADPVPPLASAAALSFAVDGYLRAIEDVFDEPTLRERLDSTVY